MATEVLAATATVVIYILWYRNPAGNYEALAGAAGAFTVFLELLRRGISRAYDRRLLLRFRTSLLPLGSRSTFKAPVPIDELDDLYRVFTLTLGQDIMGLPELRRILIKNPNAIWRVGLEVLPGDEAIPGKKPEYIGFFEVFPLRNGVTKGLFAGKSDARTFRHSDICKRTSDSDHYYVASVGEIPGTILHTVARAYVLRELFAYFEDLNEDRAFTVYARPLTHHGLRLLKNHGFAKTVATLPDNSAVWYRRLGKGELTRRTASARTAIPAG